MKRKSGFTMIEIILILVIISTALITIIQGVSKTTQYISEMRQRTIALNLAKEGIEAVYNIRNTNWRRRSANRDQCWIKLNPMVDEENPGCENDNWIKKGPYSLEQENGAFALKSIYKLNDLDNKTNYGSGIYHHLESTTNSSSTHLNNNYKIYFLDGKQIPYNVYQNLNSDQKNKINTSQGNYFRIIRVLGLYDKNNGNELDCQKGEGNCGNNSAKELRFCSRVFYTRPYQGSVNLCAIMTNFIE